MFVKVNLPDESGAVIKLVPKINISMVLGSSPGCNLRRPVIEPGFCNVSGESVIADVDKDSES